MNGPFPPDAPHRWHDPLAARAAGGLPLWWHRTAAPSAVLAGMRPFVERFRAAGLGPGDRVVLALPPGPVALAAIAAALWDDLTLVLADARADPVALAVAADPSLALAPPGGLGGRHAPWAVELDPFDLDLPPLDAFDPARRRATLGPPTIAVRALVPPSAPGALVALSNSNLSICAQAVIDALAPGPGRWLSTMPWTRAEGLVIDALPVLFGATEVVRPAGDPSDGPAWIDAIAAALDGTTTLSLAAFSTTVVRALVERFGGAGPLADLDGGLVVGPGVDADLAAVLATTRLRPARGAAELSGLVTLGEPGLWRVGVAGRAATCDARPDGAGGLAVTGAALALGTFEDGQLTWLDPGRVVAAKFN